MTGTEREDDSHEACGDDVPDEVKQLVEDMPEGYGADELDDG